MGACDLALNGVQELPRGTAAVASHLLPPSLPLICAQMLPHHKGHPYLQEHPLTLPSYFLLSTSYNHVSVTVLVYV